MLAPEPGEVVLDLCAARAEGVADGGADGGGRGALVANEINFARAKALSGNLERWMGVRNAAVVSESPDRLAGGVAGGLRRGAGGRALLRRGHVRRDTEARSAWTGGSPGVRGAAGKILISAARMVKPGGGWPIPLHVQRNENEGVVGEFLKTHPEFSPAEYALPGRRDGPKTACCGWWPHGWSGGTGTLRRF